MARHSRSPGYPRHGKTSGRRRERADLLRAEDRTERAMCPDPQSDAGDPCWGNWPAWFGEVDVPMGELLGMLRPYPARLMRPYRVDRRVGNMQNNDLALLSDI